MGDAPPGSEYSRETPAADLSTIESGVRVPLAQAAITGVVAFLLAGLAGLRYGWHWTSPVVFGVAGFCLAWWGLLVNTRRLLKTIESVVGKDLDGDGEIGFTVELTENLLDGKRRMRFVNFPATERQVLRFATAMTNGILTTYGNHGLSRRIFSVLRDESISRGLCAWTDPANHPQGFSVTKAGRHVFERLILEMGV